MSDHLGIPSADTLASDKQERMPKKKEGWWSDRCGVALPLLPQPRNEMWKNDRWPLSEEAKARVLISVSSFFSSLLSSLCLSSLLPVLLSLHLSDLVVS